MNWCGHKLSPNYIHPPTNILTLWQGENPDVHVHWEIGNSPECMPLPKWSSVEGGLVREGLGVQTIGWHPTSTNTLWHTRSSVILCTTITQVRVLSRNSGVSTPGPTRACARVNFVCALIKNLLANWVYCHAVDIGQTCPSRSKFNVAIGGHDHGETADLWAHLVPGITTISGYATDVQKKLKFCELHTHFVPNKCSLPIAEITSRNLDWITSSII